MADGGSAVDVNDGGDRRGRTTLVAVVRIQLGDVASGFAVAGTHLTLVGTAAAVAGPVG